MPSLTIWCNADLPESAATLLRESAAEHRLLFESTQTNNLTAGTESPLLAQADIALGQPDPSQAASQQSLRWVHLTSAGYTRYDYPEILQAIRARSAFLTNSSSVYDEPCAQHLLAMMLSFARALPRAAQDQLQNRSWDYKTLRPAARILENETVLLLGYGAIARRLAELLQPFNLKVIAFRRSVRGDERVPTHPISALPQFLADGDHIVNALPANPETVGLLDARMFGLMKPSAILYNVGRGVTVDQPALATALVSKRLAGAYLDVTEPEPLPSESPLWTTRNCWITPHVGGGMQDEAVRLVRHFIANLRSFEEGTPLRDRLI